MKRTLAERVADRLTDYGHDYDIAPVAVDEMLRRNAAMWFAIAEFVLAAGARFDCYERGDVCACGGVGPGNRYDAALAALAKALGIEEEDQ